jgi:hypothetical protein
MNQPYGARELNRYEVNPDIVAAFAAQVRKVEKAARKPVEWEKWKPWIVAFVLFVSFIIILHSLNRAVYDAMWR